MDKKNVDYSLYLVTDRELMYGGSIEETVKNAVIGGCGIVQLREKNCPAREFYDIAIKLKKICGELNVPLIINDRVDIAIATDCDGVHIGQKDLPAEIVRKIIGKDKIMGVSASNMEKALEAEKNGADYIGVGAVFSTGTKSDTNPVSKELLGQIKKSVKIPVVAIGGIKKENIEKLYGTGIDGVAVVSAIVSEPDTALAAEKMKKAVQLIL